MRILITWLIGLFICTAANADAEFTLKSSAFKNNGTIPIAYTCNGQNLSPPLSWENAPKNTQSFALVIYSPDTPMGIIYLWTLYNIPNTTHSLGEGEDVFPDEVVIGGNSFGETSYRGPCPPDENLHHYYFIIYALDTVLDVHSGVDVSDVLMKIKRHEIKHAELIGVFSH